MDYSMILYLFLQDRKLWEYISETSELIGREIHLLFINSSALEASKLELDNLVEVIFFLWHWDLNLRPHACWAGEPLCQ
jgi:hypothetical protein